MWVIKKEKRVPTEFQQKVAQHKTQMEYANQKTRKINSQEYQQVKRHSRRYLAKTQVKVLPKCLLK